ncbi:Calx-beta domain-containing protein [Saccharothrix sp. BKS2]|uniref:Calx-beta domain-containing protein n=1 Tax=Saccharothrix sp. BKS2 TaxID=3064400 RepID=UPI0039EB5948
MRKTTLWVLASVVLAGLVVPAGATAGTGAACAPATVEVGDVAQAEGTGGTTLFRFPVSVAVAPGCVATGSVRYRTVDGASADRDPGRAGSDYAAGSGVLTWQGDTATRYVTVAVAGDAAPERVEVFWVSLDLPTGVLITGRSGAGWITDDDSPACPPGENCDGSLSTEGTGVCWRLSCPASAHFSATVADTRHVRVRTLDNGGAGLGYVPVEDLVLTVPPGSRRAVVRFTITAPPGQEVRIPVEFFSPSSGTPGNMRTVLTLVKS